MGSYLAEETRSVLEELEGAIAEGHVFYGTPSKLFWRSLESIRLEVEHNLGGLSWASAAQIAQSALKTYWLSLERTFGAALPFRPFCIPDQPQRTLIADDAVAMTLARGLGRLASQSEPVTAGYWLGEIYTQLLPNSERAQFGVYYTPPALTLRLMELLRSYGVNWRTAKAIDPACGGGAFLSPIAIEKRRALQGQSPAQVLTHIAEHVRGYEIDPFGAWMSQVLLEATLYDLCVAAGLRLPKVVETVDTLEYFESAPSFDVVIGNPPYGRITLSQKLREAYTRSVYGHANLYGLFMDLAVRLVTPGGLIAFVTPTSFLGGQYSRNLRSLMITEAPPVAIDLVSSRKGVFTDVLQETLLAIYQHSSSQESAQVSIAELVSESEAIIHSAGEFIYPTAVFEPWLLPRNLEHGGLIDRIRSMPHRLKDYGYKVSTGPLVWNRHKAQLTEQRERSALPIIWAESITRDGNFSFRTDKKNHLPFLRLRDRGRVVSHSAVMCIGAAHYRQRATPPIDSSRIAARVY